MDYYFLNVIKSFRFSVIRQNKYFMSANLTKNKKKAFNVFTRGRCLQNMYKKQPGMKQRLRNYF